MNALEHIHSAGYTLNGISFKDIMIDNFKINSEEQLKVYLTDFVFAQKFVSKDYKHLS